jgi:transposase-like protein
MANEMQNVVFQDEAKARKWLESHLWADGRVCGYCGTVDNSTQITGRESYYQCNETSCRKQFTVQVGTLFERSHIPLNKWLLAAFLMSCSKKGISTHQLHRMIGVSYKSTWFMTHRLREAMRDGKSLKPTKLGSAAKSATNMSASATRRTSAARAKSLHSLSSSAAARSAPSMCRRIPQCGQPYVAGALNESWNLCGYCKPPPALQKLDMPCAFKPKMKIASSS